MLGEGDLDPVTLLPMIDINPRYVPRVLKALPFVANGANRPGKDKGKAKAGILSFFGQSVPARFFQVPYSGTFRSCCETQDPPARKDFP